MELDSLLVLIGSGLIQALGSVLVKYATLPGQAESASRSWFFLEVGLAMILFTAGGLLFARGLARLRLSVAQPVFSATVFLAVTLGSVLLFHEQLSPFQLAGMATIIGGIVLVII